MEAALVPCGFSLAHLYRHKHDDFAGDVTDTASQAILVSAVVAMIGFYGGPAWSWSIVAPPLVLVVVFTIYQHIRSPESSLQ